MNQRPQGLKVQKVLTGFPHYKSAEGLAPVTVSGYERDLKLWIEYQGDVSLPFWDGGLTLLSAAPGIGKTSWMLRMLLNAAALGVPSVLGCYEHTEDELKFRLGKQAQATVATAHAIARVVYRMLKYKLEYEPLNVNEYQKRYEEQQIKYMKKTCVEPVETRRRNWAINSSPRKTTRDE